MRKHKSEKVPGIEEKVYDVAVLVKVSPLIN